MKMMIDDVAIYGNTGCWVFKGGLQNYIGFWLKINILKGNYYIFWIDVVSSCQKLGIILEKKGFKNWSCQKKSITKNVYLNWYFQVHKIFDLKLT